MEQLVTETIQQSPYPFWIKVLLALFILGIIGFVVYYCKKKGDNIATKEDIGKITKTVESIKLDLNKEFESYKYLENLCNSIDKVLISWLLKCKQEIFDIEEAYNIHGPSHDYIVTSLEGLAGYLKCYSIRYGDIEETNQIIEIYNYITELDNYKIDFGDGCPVYPNSGSPELFIEQNSKLIISIDTLLAKFLPKLEI